MTYNFKIGCLHNIKVDSIYCLFTIIYHCILYIAVYASIKLSTCQLIAMLFHSWQKGDSTGRPMKTLDKVIADLALIICKGEKTGQL